MGDGRGGHRKTAQPAVPQRINVRHHFILAEQAVTSEPVSVSDSLLRFPTNNNREIFGGYQGR